MGPAQSIDPRPTHSTNTKYHTYTYLAPSLACLALQQEWPFASMSSAPYRFLQGGKKKRSTLKCFMRRKGGGSMKAGWVPCRPVPYLLWKLILGEDHLYGSGSSVGESGMFVLLFTIACPPRGVHFPSSTGKLHIVFAMGCVDDG